MVTERFAIKMDNMLVPGIVGRDMEEVTTTGMMVTIIAVNGDRTPSKGEVSSNTKTVINSVDSGKITSEMAMGPFGKRMDLSLKGPGKMVSCCHQL